MFLLFVSRDDRLSIATAYDGPYHEDKRQGPRAAAGVWKVLGRHGHRNDARSSGPGPIPTTSRALLADGGGVLRAGRGI